MPSLENVNKKYFLKKNSKSASIKSNIGNFQFPAGSSASSAATDMDLAVTAAAPSSISYGAGNINFSVTVRNDGLGFGYPDMVAMINLYVAGSSGLTIYQIMGYQQITNIPIIMMTSGQSISTNFNIDISAYGQPGNNYFYFMVMYATNNGLNSYFPVFEPDSNNIIQLNSSPAGKSGSSSSGTSSSSTSSSGITSSTNSSIASSIASSTNSSVASSIASSTSSSSSAGGSGAFNFHDDFNRPDSDIVGNGWMQPGSPSGSGADSYISNQELVFQGGYSNSAYFSEPVDRTIGINSNFTATIIFTMDAGSKLIFTVYDGISNNYMFNITSSAIEIQKNFSTLSETNSFFNPNHIYSASILKITNYLSLYLLDNNNSNLINIGVMDDSFDHFSSIKLDGGYYDFMTTNYLKTYIDDFNISGN